MKRLLILLAFVGGSMGQEVICSPGTDYLPHEDCTLFYICDNGVPIVEECAGGLYWNQEESYCDFPINVPECQGGTRPPIDGTTTVSITTTSQGTTQLPPGQCPPDGFHQIPHEERCDAYYVCIDGERLEPYRTCPEGLYFDPSKEECNFASDVDCTPGGTTIDSSSSPTALPTSTVTPFTTTSPAPTTTNPSLTTTTGRPDIPACPDTGTVQLPYPGNCTLYVQCVEGFPIVFKCPDGQLFDMVELMCKPAESAQCTEDGPRRLV